MINTVKSIMDLFPREWGDWNAETERRAEEIIEAHVSAELASVTRERDALRTALEQLATQAEYLAGRGFVGNMKREDCEKQTIEQVRKARAALAAKG